MKVKMLDPALGNKAIQEELDAAALGILHSGKFILGEPVEAFENTVKNYLNVKDAIAVSSGTDALVLALMALGIGKGDEVICPSFTFFATAGAVARVGAKPVFADIDLDTFCITQKTVEPLITESTKAIIPVHLFGQCADSSVIEMAKRRGIKVIEDVAQAMCANIDGKMAGAAGDIGCFSFFPSKNLGGFGDGGMVTTNDEALSEKLRSLRNHGMTEHYHHPRVGGNFRMDALQASLLNVKMNKSLEDDISRRRENAKIYLDKLFPMFYKLPEEKNGHHTYNQFTVMIPHNHRDKIKEWLAKDGIASAVYYPKGLHLQPCFAHLTKTSLPNTERASEEVLSLPIAPEVSTDMIEHVVKVLNKYVEEGR